MLISKYRNQFALALVKGWRLNTGRPDPHIARGIWMWCTAMMKNFYQRWFSGSAKREFHCSIENHISYFPHTISQNQVSALDVMKICKNSSKVGTFFIPCSTKWLVLSSKIWPMQRVMSEQLHKWNWKNLNLGKNKYVSVNLFIVILHRC